MPSWWRKSSSKEVKKKGSKDNIFDGFRKFKFLSDEKGSFKSSGGSRRDSLDTASENGSGLRVDSRSPSPSNPVSRCQSFAERPLGKPLPLPCAVPSILGRTESGINLLQPLGNISGRSSPGLPLPSPDCILLNRLDVIDLDGGSSSSPVSSVSSAVSFEPADQQDNGPVNANCNNCGIALSGRGLANGFGGSSVMNAAQSPKLSRKNSGKDILRPGSPLSHHNNHSNSSKKLLLNNRDVPTRLQIPVNGILASAPESSMSSPSRSPMRAYVSEQSQNNAFWATKPFPETAFFGSGHCSSPGSGYNSGHNSMGGDMAGQPFWQQSRGSPECSPIPSPRMTSGPSSRVQSGAVTPLHPRALGAGPESPSSWLEEGQHHGHRLPLPPLSISNSSPFAASCSAASSSCAVPRSPGRADNPLSPGSRWKKGKLLGRGTFGHVYAGLNNETGKMCAMKEVTMLSDDPKSKESVKQLEQEIAVLSRLSHKNIVQYYGSEMIADKLYIYLEYVSGGSIHKLLQEYGKFEEPIIRSYSRQILAGLAYLHQKNTVHRDIKGANILVDPNGQVKVADFGMAKHITAQSCPLSFKGSPYWMAPEVIINSNGSNLAVDIWSLGCTVLEMATAKPPWSQYEGVAAMFKIGNSKELPIIPDYLSEDCKGFLRLCLQRNPILRPTAAQLLEHPFVKHAEPYAKLDVATQNSEAFSSTNNVDRSMGAGHTRNLSSLDTDYAAGQLQANFVHRPSSEQFYLQKNISMPISCPVSPCGSPLIQPRSPHYRSGRMSPSPISTPLASSGTSTPLTGGHGAIPAQLNGSMKHSTYADEGFVSVPRSPNRTVKQSTYADEGFVSVPRSPNRRYINDSSGNGVYHDMRCDVYRGTPMILTPEGSPRAQEQLSDDGILGQAYGRMTREINGEAQRQYCGQVALAEHVSQQLLKIPSKFPEVGFRPSSPLLGRSNGHDYC
ncbi:mitogen-activated protein kinase kinase kinase YODA isoform X2 [Cryptomeria japonica]|uniref:mitogen-activated protein kinase kinase kinase YODA isoform X2 n=1 Tax=Cryptomeria japonica TaxID=3369 RepID=UPI0027DA241B|nr:mitogen-activated protein kinase kinase kinase YODA isoform X2 [Cryptomeria japonica]